MVAVVKDFLELSKKGMENRKEGVIVKRANKGNNAWSGQIMRPSYGKVSVEVRILVFVVPLKDKPRKR